jgi:hypothetical protein
MDRVIVWQRGCPLPEAPRDVVALAQQWRSRTRERLGKLGGELLIELGSTVVHALEPPQLARALEQCIAAVTEAEREAGPSGGGICCGVTIGSVELDLEHGVYTGDALDRAQVLANAGEPYEVLLDGPAQRAAAGAFLFARELLCGIGLSAAVIDRAFPRRGDCQRALARLTRPNVAPNGAIQLESLRKLAKSSGRHRVLLVGALGLGITEWTAEIGRELAPSLWLDVRAPAVSLAPLGALTSALARVSEAAKPEALLTESEESDRQALTTLQAVRDGAAVARRDVVLALRHYLARAGERGHRALVSVDPAPLVDPSTVGVVAEAAREGSPSSLVIMRLLLDGKPPEALARGGGLSELRVRGLSQHEARTFAASMLGLEAPNDIARRAAAMGGGSPLAVAEAVRVLVSSGDVVFRDGSFRWRRGPAGRLNMAGFESLVEERIDALAAPLRRALEIVATVADPDDAALVAGVADADGFVAESWPHVLEELDRHGFLALSTRGIVLSSALRPVVQATLSPGRTLELHRAIAQVLERRLAKPGSYARATLAFHLARAQRIAEAVPIFLEVAQVAADHGFVRSGVRLAAAAVEFDPSDDTRARAAELVEEISARQSKPSGSQPSPELSAALAAPHGVEQDARYRAVGGGLAACFSAKGGAP